MSQLLTMTTTHKFPSLAVGGLQRGQRHALLHGALQRLDLEEVHLLGPVELADALDGVVLQVDQLGLEAEVVCAEQLLTEAETYEFESWSRVGGR